MRGFYLESIRNFWADKELTSAAKLLWLWLAERTEQHPCFSAPELAAALGMGERTVFRARLELFAAGWLDWSVRGPRPSEYTVLVPKP